MIRPFSRHVLSGMAERKLTLLLPIAIILLGVIFSPPSAFAQPFNCNGFFDSGTFDNVVVESGAVCQLHSVTVGGNIQVNQGGSLTVFFSEVNGNIFTNDAKIVSVQRSAVNGDLVISKTTLFTVVAFNTINGNLDIQDADASISIVVDNEINGNIIFKNNLFGLTILDGNIISGNTVNGNLECNGNIQLPNNRFSGANSVEGNKLDQCKNL